MARKSFSDGPPSRRPWVQHTIHCCANVQRPQHFKCLPGKTDEQRILEANDAALS